MCLCTWTVACRGVLCSRQLDKMTAELKETSKALEKEKLKTEELLYDMLPEKVARQLTQGVAVKAGQSGWGLLHFQQERNVGQTSDRRGGALMGFFQNIDTILN